MVSGFLPGWFVGLGPWGIWVKSLGLQLWERAGHLEWLFLRGHLLEACAACCPSPSSISAPFEIHSLLPGSPAPDHGPGRERPPWAPASHSAQHLSSFWAFFLAPAGNGVLGGWEGVFRVSAEEGVEEDEERREEGDAGQKGG